MEKYYRVLKTTPAFEKGAILVGYESNTMYTVISDMWDTVGTTEMRKQYANHGNSGQAGEAKAIVENSPEWYERVYPSLDKKKVSYVTKDKAIKNFEEEK